MMRLFILSLLAGIALTVTASVLLPLPRNERFPSSIEVLTNGGRQESFIIHWPQDRIALPGQLPGTEPVVTGGALVMTTTDSPVSIELFRVRDSAGNVIGVASRTTARLPGQRLAAASVSNWTLMIPSRGTLLLTQENSADLSARPTAEGYMLPAETPAFWAPGSRYRITAGPAPGGRGRMVQGSEEFEGLSGTFSEIWELKELTAEGRSEGRITLATAIEAPQ